MNYPVMWVWNPTSEQLIEVASQLINPPPRYEDWKSDTESVAHFELPTVGK